MLYTYKPHVQVHPILTASGHVLKCQGIQVQGSTCLVLAIGHQNQESVHGVPKIHSLGGPWPTVIVTFTVHVLFL